MTMAREKSSFMDKLKADEAFQKWLEKEESRCADSLALCSEISDFESKIQNATSPSLSLLKMARHIHRKYVSVNTGSCHVINIETKKEMSRRVHEVLDGKPPYLELFDPLKAPLSRHLRSMHTEYNTTTADVNTTWEDTSSTSSSTNKGAIVWFNEDAVDHSSRHETIQPSVTHDSEDDRFAFFNAVCSKLSSLQATKTSSESEEVVPHHNSEDLKVKKVTPYGRDGFAPPPQNTLLHPAKVGNLPKRFESLYRKKRQPVTSDSSGFGSNASDFWSFEKRKKMSDTEEKYVPMVSDQHQFADFGSSESFETVKKGRRSKPKAKDSYLSYKQSDMEYFISLIEQREAIWNPHNKDFNRKAVVMEHFTEIELKCSKFMPFSARTPGKCAKERWEEILMDYSTHIAHIKKTPSEGSERTSEFPDCFPFADRLWFLDAFKRTPAPIVKNLYCIGTSKYINNKVDAPKRKTTEEFGGKGSRAPKVMKQGYGRSNHGTLDRTNRLFPGNNNGFSTLQPKKRIPMPVEKMSVELRYENDVPMVAKITAGKSISLRYFRHLFGVHYTDNCRFFFKSTCEDGSAQYQWTLLFQDEDILPVFQNRITAICRLCPPPSEESL